jgi:hypothetical protein
MVHDGKGKLSLGEILAEGFVAEHLSRFQVQNVIHNLVVQPEVVAQRNEITRVFAETLQQCATATMRKIRMSAAVRKSMVEGGAIWLREWLSAACLQQSYAKAKESRGFMLHHLTVLVLAGADTVISVVDVKTLKSLSVTITAC